MPNMIQLKNICQKYKNTTVFDNLNIEIGAGEFVSLMGPSGCGKSTILRYLTGLQTPTSGEIIKPEGNIPMVFQTPSSLEWKTVLENVALPLIIKKVNKKEAHSKAKEILKIVGLEAHENKFAKYPLLSGGQLQRVAIARGLIINPSVLVLDEPFSALDSVNRKNMQHFLRELFEGEEAKGLKPIIILITHDEREAVFLSDKIIHLSKDGYVNSIIDVDASLGKVRNEDTRKSEQFHEIVNYIEEL